MKTKWYLHESCCLSEIAEQLHFFGVELDGAARDNLANNIREKFYEVGFIIDFDEKTGEINSIELMK
jgi:hypothetical protein